MPTRNPVVPISDSISRALERLFKTGGFALAFGFGGLLLTLSANLMAADLRMPMFYVGCALTFVCLAYFVVSGKRTREVARRIKDDLPLLDGLQQLALQLTDLASLTQAVAFKHLSTIQRGVETILPLVDKLPVIGSAARASGLADMGKLSSAIVVATDSAKETIRQLEDSIRAGDLKRLSDYSAKLSEALSSLRAALSA